MDTVIRDSTIPSGSVILAYGAPAPRSRLPKILALLAGIFGTVLLLVCILVPLLMRVPVPEHPLALAFLPTSFRLPDSMPEAWRNAQRAADPLPIFVGVERDAEGNLHPFTIVPKTAKLVGSSSSFLWTYVGDAVSPVQKQSFASLPDRFWDYLRGSWLLVNWDDVRLSGPLSRHSWKTRLTVPEPTESLRSIQGDGYLDLSVFPNARESIVSILPPLDLDPVLLLDAASLRWTHGVSSTGIGLTMTSPITNNQAVALGAAVGLADFEEIVLQDGSPSILLKDPVNVFASSTIGTWPLPNGGTVQFTERSVVIETGLLGWNETRVPEACDGDLLFILPDGFPARLFGLRDEKGRVSICW